MLNVTKPSLPSINEYIDEISDIWESHWLTNMGVKHKEFERQLVEYLNADNISLFCNGHMALEMCLQSFDLKGEVITTPFTFASTVHAIVRNGLTPVFCDINDYDYTLDTDMLESLITDHTAAIVPVHVYGNICNLDEIDRIAENHNLKVIYDAAHAFGVTYRGKTIANYGDASIFSFHATKVFNTIEGGAVCFRDIEIGRRLKNLKNFGIQNEDTVEYVGGNAKMNEFSAAMGLCNLRYIDSEIAKRKLIFTHYCDLLKNISGLKLPEIQQGMISNYGFFPVLIDKDVFGMSRDMLRDRLLQHDIRVRKYFYPLVNEFDCYKDSFNVNETPAALRISRQILTFPLYADLDFEDVERICEVVRGR